MARREQTPAQILAELATRHGIPYDLADIIWLVESSRTFDPTLRGPIGEVGPMQVTPPAAKDIGMSWERILTDPKASMEAGVRYASQQFQRFDDPILAIAAYNAGPGTVERLRKQYGPKWTDIYPHLPARTRWYIDKALEHKPQLASGGQLPRHPSKPPSLGALVGAAPGFGASPPSKIAAPAPVAHSGRVGPSTIKLGSVEDERLNRGLPTLIPFYDVSTGRDLSTDEAIERALALQQSGRKFPSFPTNEAATRAAMLNSRAIAKEIESGMALPKTQEEAVDQYLQRLPKIIPSPVGGARVSMLGRLPMHPEIKWQKELPFGMANFGLDLARQAGSDLWYQALRSSLGNLVGGWRRE